MKRINSRTRRGIRPGVEVLEARLALSFTAAATIPVGASPSTVVAADFNRDGHADFAVTNSDSHSVSVRLGNGQGGFVGVPDVTNPNWDEGPSPLAVGQFTNDGFPDLALGFHSISGGFNFGQQGLLRGDGQGGFTFGGSGGQAKGDLRSLAVADFNGDGRDDFAYADAGSRGLKVVIVTGESNGATGPLISTGTAVPQFVSAGDFDRDGKQDLAVALDVGSQGQVWIYRGDGKAGFGTPVPLAVGSQPRSVAVGDFTGDGFLDLVTANSNLNGTVTVWRGLGNGLFAASQDVPVGKSPRSVAVADFNRDGRLDFATANTFGDTVSVRLGNGDGTFTAQPDVRVGGFPGSLVLADFNGDGMTDLAVANGGSDTVTVLLNTFPIPVQPPAPAPRPLTVSLVAVKRRGRPPRLRVVVRYVDTGEIKAQFNSPFQRTAYRQMAVLALDTSGDGAADMVQITARRLGPSKKRYTRLIPV